MADAEQYKNTLYGNAPARRFWVDPHVLVGGSILDKADWEHIQKDFGIGMVINLEDAHSDRGKVPDQRLVELPVCDDGQPKPTGWYINGIQIAAAVIGQNDKIYVHCQLSGNRSAIMAYAILRKVVGLGIVDAKNRIRAHIGGWGETAIHRSYLHSAEASLAFMEVITAAAKEMKG